MESNVEARLEDRVFLREPEKLLKRRHLSILAPRSYGFWRSSRHFCDLVVRCAAHVEADVNKRREVVGFTKVTPHWRLRLLVRHRLFRVAVRFWDYVKQLL